VLASFKKQNEKSINKPIQLVVGLGR